MNYMLGGFSKFWKNVFCFPHSTSTCKFDHDYISEKWKIFWTFFQTFDKFYRYLTSKYISKSNCVLHVGKFYKKNHFFGSRFFKFHRHVIRFSCKKRPKKRLPVEIFIKKISRKNEKNRKNLSNFPNMWHKNDTKNQHFQKIFTYGGSWEKWYNVLKNVISDVLQTNLSNSR